MHILLIEDDLKTANYIRQGMLEAGHSCDCVEDGADGLYTAMRQSFDVIIVDRMLPGLDGLSLVKSLRAANKSSPVIFLTSIGGLDDRVEGLNAGADDYLVKPFAFSELFARVNALARRPTLQYEPTVLRIHDLEIDLIRRSVTRGGQPIELLPKEFQLLEHLVRAEGRVLTRTMLLEKVWGFHFDPQTSVVETHISRLRAKIDKPFDVPLVQTVRQTGYRINVSP